MNISWSITEQDIQNVKKVIAENDNAFLRIRNERNVYRKNIIIDKDSIIKTMIMCLLTSQQRSGPNSVVGQFLRINPFPVTSENIERTNDVKSYIRTTLNQNRLTRYINRISGFFTENITKIYQDKWSILIVLENLLTIDSKQKERELAQNISYDYKGFGPKQSRNFLQALGLTKYEIPLDSRITNWFNEFGFPVPLTLSSLSDNGYYNFVSDGIQTLCKKAEIYPCLLDAAIFSSYDNGQWTEENTIF